MVPGTKSTAQANHNASKNRPRPSGKPPDLQETHPRPELALSAFSLRISILHPALIHSSLILRYPHSSIPAAQRAVGTIEHPQHFSANCCRCGSSLCVAAVSTTVRRWVSSKMSSSSSRKSLATSTLVSSSSKNAQLALHSLPMRFA